MGAGTPAGARDPDRGPGRPREPEVDDRILDAALRLLARGGYTRMSMEQVAGAAGVTKPTIYRRYRGKAELAMAAIVYFCDKEPPVYSGDTRDDLIAQLSNFRRALDRPSGMVMLGTVLAEERETPELLAAFREYLVQPRRQALRTILGRARERGELRDTADIDLAVNMAIGAYYAQYLAAEPLADDWAERVADTILALLAP